MSYPLNIRAFFKSSTLNLLDSSNPATASSCLEQWHNWCRPQNALWHTLLSIQVTSWSVPLYGLHLFYTRVLWIGSALRQREIYFSSPQERMKSEVETQLQLPHIVIGGAKEENQNCNLMYEVGTLNKNSINTSILLKICSKIQTISLIWISFSWCMFFSKSLFLLEKVPCHTCGP